MKCNSQLQYQLAQEIKLLVPGIDRKMLDGKLSSIIAMYDIKALTKNEYRADIIEKIEMYTSAKKLEGLSPKTIKSYETVLKDFAKSCECNVEEVSTNDIRSFLGGYFEINAASTLDNKLSILKSFFAWLLDEEVILKDPVRKIKPIKGEKRLRQGLSVEELELVRDSCTDLRDRAVIEFFYATGCRLDEVVGLKKSDINFDNLSLKVIGKGNKERVVYLSGKTKIHLMKYFLSRRDNSDYLFVTNRKPYAPLKHRAMQKVIEKIGKQAKINRTLHPHLFRHTLASLMLNNGADISTVQSVLGHESISTTQNYARLNCENVQIEYRKHLVV